MNFHKLLRVDVSSAILTVTMMTVFIPLPARAADASPKPNICEQLIADVYPIHQHRWDLAMIDATPNEVAAVEFAKPGETNNWQNLHLGEFETESAFKHRQEEARIQESRAYRQAIEHWMGEVKAADGRLSARLALRATIARRDLTPKMVAHAPEKPLGELVLFTFHPQLALPVFDRTLMGFDNFQLPCAFDEVAYQANPGILGQFNVLPVNLRIRINDLPVAQKFKEDVAAGKVMFVMRFEPWLTAVESPIITKPEHDEREVDASAVAKSALEYLLVVGASAAGADHDAVNNSAHIAEMTLHIVIT